MVLPAPAAPDREGPNEPEWLALPTRVFRRTERGVVVLCDEASPGRLRDLVVGLCRAGLPPEVVADPTEFEDLPVGSVVVLVVQARHATWLNINRPVLRRRALRLVLFSDGDATAALRKEAPDAFDWISHRVECPPLAAAPHAVRGLRGALRARVAGVKWTGRDLDAAFAAAFPGRALVYASAAATEEEMAGRIRGLGRVWVAWRDVDGPAALGRVRRAHAAAHRQTRLILVHPAMAVPDFWPVHDRYAELGAACAVLQKAGAASPGRLAALAGLEPEAVGLLAERVRGGQAREGLEQKLLEQKDPGAWLTEGTASSVFPSPPEWRAGRRPQVLVADEARPVDQPMRLHATTWPIEREGSDLAEGDAFSRSRARDANEAALRHAVVEAGARGDRQGEAAARLALGRALRRRYAGLEAESTLRAAVGAYAAVSDRAGESEARGELGHILLLMGRTREAEAMVHDALSLAESTEGPRGRQVARLRTMLGDVYSRTDRHKEGAQSYEQALSLYRAVGDQRGEADVLASQGELYVRMGRLEDAERNYDMALLLYRALDKRRGEATMLMALGDLYARANRAEEAAHNYDLALSLYRLIDDRLGEANVLLALGELHMHTNHLDNANYNYNQALLLYRAIDDRLGEANALLALGDVCMHLGRLKDAERYYDQALPLYRAIDDRLGEANALASIGDLVLSSGHPYEAFSYYLASMRRHEEIGNVLGIASSRANLARASLVGKCPMRAVALLRASIAFYEGHEDHSDLVSAYRDLAIALSELGWEEAAGAALLLAWVHAAIVGHPFALLMVAKAQSAAPSSPEDVERAKAMVADAIATCERELEARGEDPYAPLTPNAMAS